METAGNNAIANSLRIAFFIPWITQSRGGTENVGQMVANALAQRGHQIHVFTFDDLRAPSVWPLQPGIVLHHLSERTTPADDSQMLIEVAQVAPDLIVGLHMNRTFLRYVECAKRLDCPIVLSEHIDPRFPVRIGSFSREERLIAFNGADRIHLLVDAFRGSLPDFLQDRICVIPNTVPGEFKQAQPGETKGRLRLVTVARLMPRKNIDRLIRTFAAIHSSVPGWTLQIIGDGPEMENLKALAKTLRVGSKVEFVGHTADPHSYYAKAHLFVLPSLFEGFPMSSLEAMAHGLPIVGYAMCNGINVQVKHGANGLLAEITPSSDNLAECLQEVMSDAAMRERMGRESRKRFEEKFSSDIVFSEWENMCRIAIADHKPCSAPSAQSLLEAKLHERVFGLNCDAIA